MNIKRTIAVVLLCCLSLNLAGCGKTNTEVKPISEYISSDSDSLSENSPAESSISKPFPISDDYFPNLPTSDEPAEIYDIHDLSNGNFVYNANATDTSNTRRYYGEFEWVDDPKVLWQSSINEVPWPEYDAEAALEYGKAHWNDGVGLCAQFLSSCLTSGNITEYTLSSTSIALQLLHSRLGFGQFLPYDKSTLTITLPEYARPGDVVQIYCSYEGVMNHSLLMVGTDDEGRLRAVCHNLRNSGQDTYVVDYLNEPCYQCETETMEVFFYHFYQDDDEGLPDAVVNNKDILLWEEQAYMLPGEKYNREAALDYARNYPDDGLGYYGSMHTWDILDAGGISVGYPIQSALFFQLLKSHLGTAYSQKIRNDRTVILPRYVKAGDIGFVYCPYDGIIVSSFIVSERDDTGRMITLSYDLLNDGESAYKIENQCVGCGDDLKEVIFFCFDD